MGAPGHWPNIRRAVHRRWLGAVVRVVSVLCAWNVVRLVVQAWRGAAPSSGCRLEAASQRRRVLRRRDGPTSSACARRMSKGRHGRLWVLCDLTIEELKMC